MGFFKRLMRVIKANLNALLSRAEDPEKILDQVLIEMQEQQQEAQSHVAKSIADEKRIKKQYEAELRESDTWEERAMQAVEAGEDDLARQALARKAEHDELAEELKKQWEIQKESVEQLKKALQLLRKKIDEANREKNLIIARKKRVDAQQHIQETMSGVLENSAFDTMKRMTKKVEEMEAEVEAHAELNRSLQEETLEDRFKQLEKSANNSVQDDALAALKAKMGVLPKTEEKEVEKEKEVVREKVAIPRESEDW